jgi:hypothetical protein
MPTDIGYIPGEKDEQKRRRSSADQRRTRRSSSARRSSVPDDVEKQASAEESGKTGEEAGSGPEDANIVWWDGPEDPHNPYNWPTWRKVVICTLVSFLTLLTPLGSCKSSSPCNLAREWSISSRNTQCLTPTTPSCSFLCARRAAGDGRVREHQPRVGYLCGLGVCFGIRDRAVDHGTFLGDLWSLARLPRVQRRLRCLQHCLCQGTLLECADCVPPVRWNIRVCALDQRGRYHCRYGQPGKPRRFVTIGPVPCPLPYTSASKHIC